MDRKIDRVKIIGRVRRALRTKEHVSRVHFSEKNEPFYRIGPRNFFLTVKKNLKNQDGFSISKTAQYLDLSPIKYDKKK